MCTLTHLAVGGAVGVWTENGALAFALGVASHVVLDAVPHYDIEDFRIDVGLTLAGFLVLLGLGYWGTPVFWGAVGGVIPDVENLLWSLGILKESQRVFPSHTWFIRHGRRLTRRGMIPQVLLILGAIGCLALQGG